MKKIILISFLLALSFHSVKGQDSTSRIYLLKLRLGLQYFNYPYWEVGLTKNISKNTGLGISYESNFNHKLVGYGLRFYCNNIFPKSTGYFNHILFSLCPVFYTNYKISEISIRPALGWRFGHFSVFYGYNFLLKNENIAGMNTHVISISSSISYW